MKVAEINQELVGKKLVFLTIIQKQQVKLLKLVVIINLL